jgi:dephospho-CoA kinase
MPDHPEQPPGAPIVVGITGRIGAGKTSVGKYLNSNYGFQYIRYSQVLSEWLVGDPDGKGRLQEIGWEIMAGGMQPELNRRLIAQITPNLSTAVDGLRHPLDHEALKSSFSSVFHLLYVDCPSETRWEHVRGKPKYPTYDSFQMADSHQVEQQIQLLQRTADWTIHNEGTLDELYLAVDGAIRQFRKEG